MKTQKAINKVGSTKSLDRLEKLVLYEYLNDKSAR